MANFPGTSIAIGQGTTPQRIYMIDNLLTPRLLAFRQIHIWNEEPVRLLSDNVTLKLTFGNILQTKAALELTKSGKRLTGVDIQSIDYDAGEIILNPVVSGNVIVPAIQIGPDGNALDVVSATYIWDYFPVPVLEGLLLQGISTVNTAAHGASTYYTLENCPVPWYGVICDLAYAFAMERLLSDYNLWKYRLVMAIGPEQIESGSDNIPSQLQVLKNSAEERAMKTIENPKFKCGEIVAGPTKYYWEGIGGGSISGAHGIPFLGGHLNGFVQTRMG